MNQFIYNYTWGYMIESVTDHIISSECNLCPGEWMVWMTRLHPSSMLPDHNTNSTKFPILSTIRQSTVSRQLVSPSPITRNVYLNALRTIIEQNQLCEDFFHSLNESSLENGFDMSYRTLVRQLNRAF